MRSLFYDQRGSPAIEFALIAPVFIAIVFGVLDASLFYFQRTQVQSGLEAASRCIQLESSQCDTDPKIIALVQGRASNVNLVEEDFDISEQECGKQIEITLRYESMLGAGLGSIESVLRSCR